MEFPHLPLPQVVTGRARLNSGGKRDPRTLANRVNRVGHSKKLDAIASKLAEDWKQDADDRASSGAGILPAGRPLLLQVGKDCDINALQKSLGLEVVSEQDEGYVVVATADLELKRLREKVARFSRNEHGGGLVASVLEIAPLATAGQLERILSPHLRALWPFRDDVVYTVDVSVETLGVAIAPQIVREHGEAQDHWDNRLEKWRAKQLAAEMEADETRMERETHVERFVQSYSGAVLAISQEVIERREQFFSLPDSFVARISISGNGLRDFVLNFPWLVDVEEPPETGIDAQGLVNGAESELTLTAPNEHAPRVCILDSGIQENHKYLSPAIDSKASRSFLPNDPGVADLVAPSGHGTRVAGAVLFGAEQPVGVVQAQCWIVNGRILDAHNCLPSNLVPARVIAGAVRHFAASNPPIRIFNHSVGGRTPCDPTRMTAWAAAIDLVSSERDVLVVQAAGNVPASSTHATRPGVMQHLAGGKKYPDLLLEPSCRISSPAQALHALTVGSVGAGLYENGNVKSFADNGRPSSFSRAGFAPWGVIKPDVVEFGGDYAQDGNLAPALTTPPEVCPWLVRSTVTPGPLASRDDVGTSFAAPQTTKLVAELAELYPSATMQLLRALVAHSAEWPEWTSDVPIEKRRDVLRHIGYGVPNRERALGNAQHRVCLYRDDQRIGARTAHIYEVPVPLSLRAPGSESPIRIAITLAYTARPRRTRLNARGYLSTWLDWRTNKPSESSSAFSKRVIDEAAKEVGSTGEAFQWAIGERSDWGQTPGARRSSGTLQKDWVVVPAYSLPSAFCIAVVGHPGWDPDPEANAPYAITVTIESVGAQVAVYAPIRAAIEQLVPSKIQLST